MIRKHITYLLLLLLPLYAPAQKIQRDLSGQKWKFHKLSDQVWLSATVPGTVHTDLLDHKRIPDPFTGAREKELQWIENEDWEYRTTIKLSAEEMAQDHIELQFDGLDTYAEIFLNDVLMLTADNMFRTWNVDIKKTVHPGKNELRIIFRSAVKKGKEEMKKLPYTLPGDEKVFARKAQYQYGWDFGPRYVTCGIWKPVRLVCWKEARLLDVQCLQRSLSDSMAELEFACEIESDMDRSAYIDIGCTDTKDVSGQRTRKIKLEKGIHSYSISYDIKNPRRWWTHDLGFPTLYGFKIDLSYDSRILDSKYSSIGLRTLELVREKDAFGSSFYFKLNGVPVFIRGANMIPPDNFLPRVSRDYYFDLISNAKESNMNMIRVWGGGVYADDLFYDVCDLNGVLVWQDLMFACAMYPGDEHFTDNVAKEVDGQIRRLRNHASLALWCGNNEVAEGWKNWDWQKQYNYSFADSIRIASDYTLLFDNLLKDMFRINDPQRAYWPSSPAIGWGHNESLLEGDSHYWGVWWGMEPLNAYRQKVGRFVSEYGFQGMPQQSTFAKMGIEPGNIDSLVYKAHQKHPSGYETINAYMLRDYKMPQKFEDRIYLSQLLQARSMRTAIESHRKAKPYCMGTMFWQLNDCWPGTSWSSIDYYGNWKAAQYEVKRDYRQVILSVEENKDSCDVFVISDALQPIQAELLMELFDLGGKIIWSKKIPINIDPNSSRIYYKMNRSLVNGRENNIVLKCSLNVSGDYQEPINYQYYFAKPKELQLQRPQIIITKPFCEKRQCITLESDVVVKDAYITINGEDVHLSDNYFDMLPGEQYTVYLPYHKHFRKIEKKVKVRSLVDTY